MPADNVMCGAARCEMKGEVQGVSHVYNTNTFSIGMGLDVAVVLDAKDNYTNGDTISGVVKLNISKTLALTSIQVKLQGVSTTSFQVPEHPEKRGKDRKEVTRCDCHKFLYDSLVVFPPPNVRQVSSSKEFSLTPGSYTYRFSFQLPLNSSCKKLEGISNHVAFNRNTFDVVVNNSALSTNVKNYIGNHGSGHRPQIAEQSYHQSHQLAPTFELGGMASVKYFVKVTCNRPSLFKVNLRHQDPFSFTPLDLDPQGAPFLEALDRSELKEVFYRRNVSLRKTIVSKDKALPTPPKKKGFFGQLLGGSAMRSSSGHASPTQKDLNFAFEVRLVNPPHLAPYTSCNFKLFLVLDSPSQFLPNSEKGSSSDGMGVIYLQRLVFELQATTSMSVLHNNTIHQARADETIPIFDNTFHNVPIDLSNATPQSHVSATSSQYVGGRSYELEIPQKFFSDWALSRDTPPSFSTCNIHRSYSLRVVVGLSSERVDDPTDRRETGSKVHMVDVVCPEIRILSGMSRAVPSSKADVSPDSGAQPTHQARYPPEKQSYTGTSAQQPMADGSQLPTYDESTRN